MNDRTVETPDETQPSDTGRASGGFLRHVVDSLRPGDPDDAVLAEADGLVPSGPEFQTYAVNFVVLTIFSASIASLGLLADSGAVVIGAMLVAPLMGPITAAAVGIVRAHNVELVRAILLIALGTSLAIATGWIVAAITASDVASAAELPREIATRTFPSLIDLGVAITAGAAAGFITTRPSINSALPGVGISVALVPPLAVVGITLQGGLNEASANALLLFATNLAAIVFAAAIVLLWSGLRPRVERGRRSVGIRLLVTLGFVAAIAFPLTLHTRQTVRDRDLNRDVLAAIAEWDADVRVVELD
ncbi:MAG: DUF389 domain-containing protein, partial [Actinomycetota bacterium]